MPKDQDVNNIKMWTSVLPGHEEREDGHGIRVEDAGGHQVEVFIFHATQRNLKTKKGFI